MGVEGVNSNKAPGGIKNKNVRKKGFSSEQQASK